MDQRLTPNYNDQDAIGIKQQRDYAGGCALLVEHRRITPADCVTELGAETACQCEQIAALHSCYLSPVFVPVARGYALSGSRQM